MPEEILWAGLVFLVLCVTLGLWLGSLVDRYFSEHPLDRDSEGR